VSLIVCVFVIINGYNKKKNNNNNKHICKALYKVVTPEALASLCSLCGITLVFSVFAVLLLYMLLPLYHGCFGVFLCFSVVFQIRNEPKKDCFISVLFQFYFSCVGTICLYIFVPRNLHIATIKGVPPIIPSSAGMLQCRQHECLCKVAQIFSE